MTKKIRAFVALEVPEQVTRQLAGLQNRLGQDLAGVKWVPADNIHLTIKFLGDISPPMVEAVSGILTAVASRPVMNLQARGLGVFPGLKKPRVLWAGLDGDIDGVAQLARELDDYLRQLEFSKESKKFRPHLTLGRFRSKALAPARLADLLRRVSDFGPLPFQAQRLVLFRSVLRPTGPVYTPLARVELGL